MHLPSSVTGKKLEGIGNGGKKEVSNGTVGPCLALTTKGRKRRHLNDCDGEADETYILSFSVMPNTPLTTCLLPAKRRRCLGKPKTLPCLGLTTKGRKRRHLNDSDGEADKKSTRRFSVMSNTPTYRLPAKRRRCLGKPRKLSMNSDPSSLDEHNWKGYRDVTKVFQNMPKKPKPSLAKVERCLEYPIKNEDIYAFIHNIRLDITRSDQLSSELDLKCLLTSSG